jgi:uncharacterized protein YyaL (SSP411 family)
LTTDRKPFWCGTFLPKINLIELLNAVQTAWTQTNLELLSTAERIADYLKTESLLTTDTPLNVTRIPLEKLQESFLSRFDHNFGGFNGAPKFPPSLLLSTLLHKYSLDHNKDALEAITFTLKQMRRGGIFDQVGGGFHRYSTDEMWLVPHFEKMLYDNANLSLTYLEAYQVTGNQEFAETAKEIFDYVLRDMTSVEGGFFSAEDADSEDIEGKFYVWSQEELENNLNQNEYDLIKKYFNVTPEGNFHAHKTSEEIKAKSFQIPYALSGNIFFLNPKEDILTISKTVKPALEKLLMIRAKRLRPLRDDKILCSWNGLMIYSLTKAAQVFDDSKYLLAAKNALNFILLKLFDGQKLYRRFNKGEAGQPAQAEDYAFIIRACLELYQTNFEKIYFTKALALQKIYDVDFWNETDGGYYDGPEDSTLLRRAQTFEDGVVSSANSVSALNLLTLNSLTGELEFKEKCIAILNKSSLLISKYPQAVPHLLQALNILTRDRRNLIIATNENGLAEVKKNLSAMRKLLIPTLTIEITDENNLSPPLLENKATYYLCRDGACDLPTNDWDTTLKSACQNSSKISTNRTSI